ncbi:hypothetical protein P3X46_022520 [Hevea brasiliensis]|uniref:Pectinesterase inhibitor domain-containing protein n=1 Tax=Hevea brasiliensis TaxID=3981 RepID=A0ABQ9L820_HEVBR|nr:cell wall / vacuolar inhibitor of fructosidase 2 [Hevea brasiliensis]XP_057989052.1 cell wall / vacuolar inhibitor of fructosidase 2-like [Hevea brasiliensis]KAJ9162771.1 hypothetical protein P3X46_022519 [Hevea brasiliensis]KAJ9162772.1 hypothetical protein P3X46_022520 [Hevea brasiliensis]
MSPSNGFFLLSLLLLFSILHAASFPTKIVDKVCKRTSNYSFCVESLYSDSRTPEADQYTLAFVAVRLAYLSASTTRDFITQLLKNENQKPLQICIGDYNMAVSAIIMADNDLNSETFFELADLANKAAAAADDCEAAFKGNQSRPLGNKNKDLKGLCEIFGVIGRLFTGH